MTAAAKVHPFAPDVDATPTERAPLLSRDDVLDQLEQLAGLEPQPTGFAELDARLGGGLFPGGVYIVGGTTGSGKTAKAVQISAGVAEARPVIYATYEIRPALLAARRAAQQLGCRWLSPLRGEIARDDILRTIPAGLMFMWRPLLGDLRRTVAQVADAEGEAPLVVIDYIQLLGHIVADAMKVPDARHAMSVVSATVRDLAAECAAPALAISAVSRGAGTRLRGKVRDAAPSELVDVAKETGSIEYDATAVIALSVSDDEDDDGRQIATVTVAKSRFGRRGHLDYRFDGASGRWEEIGEAASTRDEGIQQQIIASLEAADGPLARSAIIERGGKKYVKGRRQTVWSTIDALVRDGDLVQLGNAYALAGGRP